MNACDFGGERLISRVSRSWWLGGRHLCTGRLKAALLTAALLTIVFGAGAVRGQEQGDSVVLQGGGGEVYIGGLPPGWSAAGEIEGMPANFAAWLPQGQTGEDWREMIAAQLFADLGGRDPAVFLNQIAGSYERACDSISTTSIRPAQVNGLPSAFRAVACGRNSVSGFGEVVLFRVISGQNALYMMERIYRTEPFGPGTIPFDDALLARGKESLELGLACQRAGSSGSGPNGSGSNSGAGSASPCPEGWIPALNSLAEGQAVTVFPVAE